MPIAINPGPSNIATVNTAISVNSMQLLFILQGANMAIANQDQMFTRIFQGITYDPMFITATWASGAFATACAGGIYPSPSKGGTGLVSSVQSYAGLQGTLTHVNCTVQATTTTFTSNPFLNLTTANSGPLVADFRIYGVCYD